MSALKDAFDGFPDMIDHEGRSGICSLFYHEGSTAMLVGNSLFYGGGESVKISEDEQKYLVSKEKGDEIFAAITEILKKHFGDDSDCFDTLVTK